MYTIPTIPTDLRHEEAIMLTVNCLEFLQNVMNDVFDKIDERINKNHKKLTNLNNRINLAHKKINSLFGLNKAIKIYSPSKFPATNILFKDIPLTFSEFNNFDNKNFIINVKNYEILSNPEPVTQKLIQEKLQFYHVRNQNSLINNKIKSIKVIELNKKGGLGPIPRHLTSINSLLLYNTSENIYEYYNNMDSIINHGGKYVNNSSTIDSNRRNNDLNKRLESPPISLTNRLYSNDKKLNHEFFYTPKLNDAPEIDVPLDLPDLPGIADDITFEVSENERIAPSMFVDNLSDLPETIITNTPSPCSEEEVKIEENLKNSKSLSNSSVLHPSIQNSGVPPAPPPPPPLPQQLSSDIVLNIQTNSAPPPAPPPPPPPLPPLALEIEQASTSNTLAVSSHQKLEITKTTKNLIPNTIDVRMNLMEAIRQAGGAKGGKLRAAADVAIRKKDSVAMDTKHNKNAPNTSAGDLMADLHNRLSMRRKGISGAKDEQNNNNSTGSNLGITGSQIMSKISALLPPPELNSNSNSSEEESDSENDWGED